MGSGAQQAASSRPGEQRDEADVHVAPKAGYASPLHTPLFYTPTWSRAENGIRRKPSQKWIHTEERNPIQWRQFQDNYCLGLLDVI